VKVLMLYEYPPVPAGLATQGDLLYQGLLQAGVEAQAVHFESDQEKQWYYQWFRPDAVVDRHWGRRTLILHQRYGMRRCHGCGGRLHRDYPGGAVNTADPGHVSGEGGLRSRGSDDTIECCRSV
jgi:hypothetical protein